MLAQSVIIHHHKPSWSGFRQPHWLWGDMHTGWRRFNSRGGALREGELNGQPESLWWRPQGHFCFRSWSRWETCTRYDAFVWVRGSLAVTRRLGRRRRVEDLFESPGGCFVPLFLSGGLTLCLPGRKKNQVARG